MPRAHIRTRRCLTLLRCHCSPTAKHADRRGRGESSRPQRSRPLPGGRAARQPKACATTTS
eukprot:3436127-Alexandrium_andersonii.AAC.1